jgi:hypothetical protein
LAIGRKPNAKIFFFSIKYRSIQEKAIATNIPILYLVGFELCLAGLCMISYVVKHVI